MSDETEFFAELGSKIDLMGCSGKPNGKRCENVVRSPKTDREVVYCAACSADIMVKLRKVFDERPQTNLNDQNKALVTMLRKRLEEFDDNSTVQ
jgi:hypothetical protein